MGSRIACLAVLDSFAALSFHASAQATTIPITIQPANPVVRDVVLAEIAIPACAVASSQVSRITRQAF